MLKPVHKAHFLQLARERARVMREALHLAIAHFGVDHRNVKALRVRVEFSEDAVRALEAEPAAQVAA